MQARAGLRVLCAACCVLRVGSSTRRRAFCRGGAASAGSGSALEGDTEAQHAGDGDGAHWAHWAHEPRGLSAVGSRSQEAEEAEGQGMPKVKDEGEEEPKEAGQLGKCLRVSLHIFEDGWVIPCHEK